MLSQVGDTPLGDDSKCLWWPWEKDERETWFDSNKKDDC